MDLFVAIVEQDLLCGDTNVLSGFSHHRCGQSCEISIRTMVKRRLRGLFDLYHDKCARAKSVQVRDRFVLTYATLPGIGANKVERLILQGWPALT